MIEDEGVRHQVCICELCSEILLNCIGYVNKFGYTMLSDIRHECRINVNPFLRLKYVNY